MLKRSVIAADITNLTDARYFSSWGVDYLHFNLDQIDIDAVIAILEWVDGVYPILEFGVESIDLLDKAMIKAMPFAVGSADKEIFEGLLGLGLDCLLFFRFGENDGHEENLLVMSEPDYIVTKTLQILPADRARTYVAAPSNIDSLEKILEENSSVGFILQGEDEVHTGMKNFDELDVVLEFLEE